MRRSSTRPSGLVTKANCGLYSDKVVDDPVHCLVGEPRFVKEQNRPAVETPEEVQTELGFPGRVLDDVVIFVVFGLDDPATEPGDDPLTLK
jgi:hypothetical protein